MLSDCVYGLEVKALAANAGDMGFAAHGWMILVTYTSTET